MRSALEFFKMQLSEMGFVFIIVTEGLADNKIACISFVKIVITNPDKASIFSAQKVPAIWEDQLIPGATIQAWIYETAEVLQQQVLPNPSIQMIYTLLKSKQHLDLHIMSDDPVLICEVLLKGSVTHKADKKAIEINAGHFNLMYAPRPDLYTFLQPVALLRGMQFFFNPHYILPLTKQYPLLETFSEGINRNQTVFVSERPVAITPAMSDIIEQLAHAPYAPAIRRFHEEHILAFLSHALAAASLQLSSCISFSQADAESIYSAKKIIDMHLSQHYTIPQLCRKILLNEDKLKTGFKAIFGMGPFAYQKMERLRLAKAKLEQTRIPVKAIASGAGYKYMNNFSIAFKNVFGITPFELRKEQKSRPK
ncbi:helix-turn-helix domain-containing protein [Panacibacter ginsenosidivorans]|uniref:Helix-turn-helix domain-containing protein n=1 Tax=Panacibacter ginsenosidivorans TaxID=1813871 RepID=A0A5B8VG75_9BACT|nr:helix-turn-helix domain-containing protein [Panacibacter ginsenosidivorans]QEC69308.1 helix-turn-helix domain-containing protein [Panacibacter ginsenosidivorans]